SPTVIVTGSADILIKCYPRCDYAGEGYGIVGSVFVVGMHGARGTEEQVVGSGLADRLGIEVLEVGEDGKDGAVAGVNVGHGTRFALPVRIRDRCGVCVVWRQ